MNYWQQGAGDGSRSYYDICLKYGVILNGPGNYGKAIIHNNDLDKDYVNKLLSNGVSSRKITDLKRFCVDMKDGDIVVLRLGTQEIYGIGIIVGDYDWSELFSDVDGWDLQHYRRVKWIWTINDNNNQPKRFNVNTLKSGDTTQKLNSSDVIDWVNTVLQQCSSNINDISLPQLPIENNREVTNEDIRDYLFEEGIEDNSINLLINKIDELSSLARWYRKNNNFISEDETRTYLVVPLLRLLGWTPQKMAIEWQNIDIALFKKLPRNDDNLISLVEVKRLGETCLNAFNQARNYATNKENCKRLIVTDGIRYGVFEKESQKYKLQAYMNLTFFKEEYKLYECKGIKEALWLMTPDSMYYD